MSDARPYSVEVFYWLPRLGGRSEHVGVNRFATAAEAAFFRSKALRSPPIPADALDFEIGEIGGPDLAQEEPAPMPAALAELIRTFKAGPKSGGNI